MKTHPIQAILGLVPPKPSLSSSKVRDCSTAPNNYFPSLQGSSAAYCAEAQGHAPSASTDGIDQFYLGETVPYIYISKYIYRCTTIILEQKLAFAPSRLQVPASMSSALAHSFLFSIAKEA